ncbi:hypothetical protein CQ054_10545 [Ochrobactrum sp. MYb29]|nr:hypothetical protein CQ054_10545 [Ochrobactrum sp. MYb29]
MKITNKTDETVTIEMTHEQALMINALIRETCSGTPMFEFDTRVGYPLKTVAKIGPELNELLYEIGVSE